MSNMTVREALLLGRVIVEAKHSTIGDLGDPGCAVGMIGEAVGTRHVEELKNRFPVLQMVCPLPCLCVDLAVFTTPGTVLQCLMHLFDWHVTVRGQLFRTPEWTMDQLTEWVSSMEATFNALPECGIEVKRLQEIVL